MKLRLASDDPDVTTQCVIEFGSPVSDEGTWLPYVLALRAGERELSLSDPAGGRVEGRCWLGLSPRDELALLVEGVGDLLAGKRHRWAFEPQEPNFAIDFEAVSEGYVVHVWLDAGNQLTDHFTWDAVGIRFFTTAQVLERFLMDGRALRAKVMAEA
ncbi:MAG: hypothetical protein VKO21_10875 [Candidatus Sericytochromatia bacterium]|nr:hypothetical protein [Candidatus Sericytochromatia bacterium]